MNTLKIIEKSYIFYILKYYEQRPQCHSAGLQLNISSTVQFPSWRLPVGWFNGLAVITEINLECRNFDVIETDAFVADAFTTVRNLTLNWPSLKILQTGAFNGLLSLQSLVFTYSSINVFTTGLLDNVAKTLTYLSVVEVNKYSTPLLVNGLTGGTSSMVSLKTVVFQHNLNDTITERTFFGLTSVVYLDLSSCQIEVIGSNSFNRISSTIEVLILRENKLKTLPYGLFGQMINRLGLKIYIDKNIWHCDCDLCYVKGMIGIEFFVTNNFDCQTPNYLKGHPIATNEFCSLAPCEVIEKPGESDSTAPTVKPDVKIICYRKSTTVWTEEVTLKPRNYDFTIGMRNMPYEIDISLEEDPINTALLWFKKAENLTKAYKSELSAKLSTFKDVNAKAVYLLCVIRLNNDAIPPQNCMSFMMQMYSFMWLSGEQMESSIGMVIIGLILCMFVGCGIGYAVLMRYPKLLMLSKDQQRKKGHHGSKNTTEA